MKGTKQLDQQVKHPTVEPGGLAGLDIRTRLISLYTSEACINSICSGLKCVATIDLPDPLTTMKHHEAP
jgi:hypothetical protein